MRVPVASFFAFLLCSAALAEPVKVEHQIGAARGFLLIRSSTGAIIGHGELSEFATGDRVTVHTTFRFRDGSLDDETSIFTQREVFRLISDRHIQRGPFFKHRFDMTVEGNGKVTLRTFGSDGKEKLETNHLDLPPDVSNGLLCAIMQNTSPNAVSTVGMVIPTGKGRLVKLVVTPEATQSFSAVAGDRRSASVFRIHMELGGVAGVVAPIVGKQPQDISVWVLEGDVPLLVREVGPLAEDGPVVSIELAGTSFSGASVRK